MKKALVMELVDIADLKSVGFKPWEFESPRGHQFYAGYPAIDRRGYLLQLGERSSAFNVVKSCIASSTYKLALLHKGSLPNKCILGHG